MPRYITFPYATTFHGFDRLVSNLFGCNDLSRLHEISAPRYDKLFEVGKDSSTIFHQIFYDKYRSGWPEMENVYEGFVRLFGCYLYGKEFLYQKFPTFRVHLPGNVAVGAFHNDGEFHHPQGEMNFIIPLTNSDDTASCWLESWPGKKDFQPMRMRVGEVIVFDGNRLTHGNKVNETGVTRVSMDFRILPIDRYDENNLGESMTLNTKFREGEYYKRFKK